MSLCRTVSELFSIKEWRDIDCLLTVFDYFWRLVHCWYTTLLVQSWQTCDDWYTNDFWLFWRLVQCTNRHKQSKDSKNSKKWPFVYQSSHVYQDYQSPKRVKNSQKSKKMTIGVPIVTCLLRLYQQCTNRQKELKDSQNSKNDHRCTNLHMCTQNPPNTQSTRPRPTNTQSPCR